MSLVIGDNFSYQGRNPLDSRMLFDTIAAMKNYSENYLPDVALTLNNEDGKMYIFNRTNDVDETTGKWREFEGGEGESIQVSGLPAATSENEGKVYQYIGADTQDYKHDFFYENKYTEGTNGYYAFLIEGGAKPYYATSETPSDGDPIFVNEEGEIEQIPLGIRYWVVDAESPSGYSIYAVEGGGQTMPTTRDSTQDIPGGQGGYQRVSVDVQEGDYDTLKNKPVFVSGTTGQGYGWTSEYETEGGQTGTMDFLTFVDELPENGTISAYDIEYDEWFELEMQDGLAYGRDTVTRNSSIDQDITETTKEVNEKYYDIIGITEFPTPSSKYANKVYRYIGDETEVNYPNGHTVSVYNQDLVICQEINDYYYWTKYRMTTAPADLPTYWEGGYGETNNIYNSSDTSVVSYNGALYTGTVNWSTYQWTWEELSLGSNIGFTTLDSFTIPSNSSLAIELKKQTSDVREILVTFMYGQETFGYLKIKPSGDTQHTSILEYYPGYNFTSYEKAFDIKTVQTTSGGTSSSQTYIWYIKNNSGKQIIGVVGYLTLNEETVPTGSVVSSIPSGTETINVEYALPKQVSSFESVAADVDTIVQYIGTTDANYTQGHFYKKTEYPNTWTEISVNSSVDTLEGLTNVEISNVQDGDIIAYNAASLKYKNIKNDPYIAGEGISLEPTTKTVTDYSAMRGPCPEGFHVPTGDDLGNINSIINSISDYKKLHMPTNCGYWAGTWQNRNEPESGWTNTYWQTDPGTYAGEGYAWHFDEYNGNFCGSTDASATYGLPIRAFKDEVVLPDSTWTEELTGKIWHNAALGLITYFDGTDYYTMADKNVGATTVWNDGDTCTDANVGLYFQQGNNYGYHYGDTVPTTDELIDVSSVEPSTYSSATWGSADHSSRWDEVNADIWGETTGVQQKTITKTGIQNLSMNESDVAFATVTLTGTTATISNAFITAETFVDYIVKNGTPAGTITITVANGSLTISSTASENLILLLRLEKVNSKSVILN